MDQSEEFEPLTRANIWYVALQVRDSEADPADVRRLFETVCYHASRKEQLPKELIQYLADGFSFHLAGGTLDAAFGITKRKPGNKKNSDATSVEIATEFLRHRIAGHSWDSAVRETAQAVCKSKSVIEKAWKLFKVDAWAQLRLERNLGRYPWTAEEEAILLKIFKPPKVPRGIDAD